jgi:recombination DNA repair RAD52 pathway protein
MTDRHKIVFATVSVNGHGSSLLRGLFRLNTSVDRSTYLAEVADKFLRLQLPNRARHSDNPTNSSTSPHATAEGDDADQPRDTHPGNNYADDQPIDMEEDPAVTEDRNPHPKNHITDTTQWPHVRSFKRRLLEPQPTHMMQKPTTIGYSQHGSPSARPLSAAPASNSQRSTQ